MANRLSGHILALVGLLFFCWSARANCVDTFSRFVALSPLFEQQIESHPNAVLVTVSTRRVYHTQAVDVGTDPYQLVLSEGKIYDLDGLSPSGQVVFGSFRELFASISPELGLFTNPFYNILHYHLRPLRNEHKYLSGQAPLRSLLLSEYKARSGWNLTQLIETDPSSLARRGPRVARIAEGLRRIQEETRLEILPLAEQVLRGPEVYAFFRGVFADTIAKIRALKIKEPVRPAEGAANRLLENLAQRLSRLIGHPEVAEIYQDELVFDLSRLNRDEQFLLNQWRVRLRSAIAELNVAMLVPGLLAMNTSLREAFAIGLFKRHPQAILEIEEAGLLDREFDVIGSKGIYEVKSSTLSPFTANSDHTSSSVITGAREKLKQHMDRFLPPELGQSKVRQYSRSRGSSTPGATKSERRVSAKNRASYNKQLERMRFQAEEREFVIEILKKYHLVEGDFSSYTVFVDGQLKEQDFPGQTLGEIDPKDL